MAYNKKTGIDSDYVNAFLSIRNYNDNFNTGSPSLSKERFLKLLEKPIQAYEEYISGHYPEQFEEACNMADKKVLSRLNDSVLKYNALPAEKKIEHVEICTTRWLKIMNGEC